MMCYKEQKNKELAIKVEKMTEQLPEFTRGYFERLGSPVTRKNNFGILLRFLIFLIDTKIIGKDTVLEITPEDMSLIKEIHITKYLNSLKDGRIENKNSKSSISTKLSVLSGFWTYLVNNDYALKNIVSEVNKNNYKKESTNRRGTGIKLPNPDDLARFQRQIKRGNGNQFNAARNQAIVAVFMATGIRSEELIGLDMKDLVLAGEEPYIMVLGKGKEEEQDEVFYREKYLKPLFAYLDIREKTLLEWGINSDAVFLSNEKKRMSKSSIDNFFIRYSNGTITPHMLRHYYGTKLYEKSKDIIFVQQQLRHGSIETAIKYYVQIDRKKLARVACGF